MAMRTYRPDIDGLRGVAVIAVVLFHAELVWLPGGFVGVDIFFVISGYLISSIILKDIHKGQFSFYEFYERRIRRIFPALFVVLLFCFVVSYHIFLPDQFVEFGKTASFASFFASNFYFAKDRGYFGENSELNPLLHTWSLSVEEQFYIVFPIVLVLAVRFFRRGVIAFALVVATVSLMFSQWAVAADPVSAFYLSTARAWELLVGYFLAAGAVPKIQNGATRNLSALAGMALICWSVGTYTSLSPFPGVSAIVPCLGAALVIHAGSSGPTLVGRLLGLRPIVFVGLISYSLYLWHWPLLVFTRHYFIGIELAPVVTAMVIVLAVALSILTWRFVERPFRISPQGDFAPARVDLRCFRTAGILILTTAMAGTLINRSEGLPDRFSDDVLAIAAASHRTDTLTKRCHNLLLSEVRRGNLCSIGAAGEPSFILWGDSYAGAFLSATDFVAAKQGRSGLYAGQSACPPLLGVTQPRQNHSERCVEFNDAIFAAIRNNPSVKNVILVGRWAMCADGRRYGNELGGPTFIADSASQSIGFEENRHVFARGVRRTISRLVALGKTVTVIGPVPEVGWNVPRSLAIQKHLGVRRHISPRLEEFESRQDLVIRTLQAMTVEYSANLILPHEMLCTGDFCSVQRDAKPLYSDDDHLSVFGAALVMLKFDTVFDGRAPSNGSS